MTDPDAADAPIKDFTIKREPHRFRIDDDVFAAPAIISPVALRKLAGVHAQLGELGGVTDEDSVGRMIGAVAGVMRILLPGASGERFAERLAGESEFPIDLQQQALPVMYWLLERYGLGRPTLPSSDSPAGSTALTTGGPSDGTSSMDGASPEESDSPN